MLLLYMQIRRYFNKICDNNRLMHVLFHIKTVIIPRDRYQPEGRYRSRDDNSPDMEKGMH